VTGIDVNTAMAPYAVQAARDAGLLADRLRLVTGDVQALPFPSQSFDAVICTLASHTSCNPDPSEHAGLHEVRMLCIS
jgi:ubiquinone/menaquinone biosynthesis C-methylase UbiE